MNELIGLAATLCCEVEFLYKRRVVGHRCSVMVPCSWFRADVLLASK